MPHHSRTAAWTSEATRRWLASCDVCRTWQLVADYYECYAPFGTGGGWWWSCGGCLLDVVDDLRIAIAIASDGVLEADQCWHQRAWEEGDYDGDYHGGECFGDAVCDDPCRLCLLEKVLNPVDDDWDALPSPCTEHGLENCPCEEGGHPHTHNGWTFCFDYENCTGCHCHLQDERHTACCKGEAAKLAFAEWLRTFPTYQPQHDVASERLGECRACRLEDELGREHTAFVEEARRAAREWIAGGRKTIPWSEVKRELGIHNAPDFGPPMCAACLTDFVEAEVADRLRLAEEAQAGNSIFHGRCGHEHTPGQPCPPAGTEQPEVPRDALVWDVFDHAGGHPYDNTLVDALEKAQEVADAILRPQAGQALRHGAPCFRKAAGDPTHTIGTHPTCAACGRYRDHLGISYADAQGMAGTWHWLDPDHSCQACNWGRVPHA